MYFERGISARIEALSRQFPALVLTGARQTGKTLMEAKWTENPSTRDSENLQSVAQILTARGKAPDVHASIVCRTPHSSVLSDGTRVVDLAQLSR